MSDVESDFRAHDEAHAPVELTVGSVRSVGSSGALTLADDRLTLVAQPRSGGQSALSLGCRLTSVVGSTVTLNSAWLVLLDGAGEVLDVERAWLSASFRDAQELSIEDLQVSTPAWQQARSGALWVDWEARLHAPLGTARLKKVKLPRDPEEGFERAWGLSFEASKTQPRWGPAVTVEAIRGFYGGDGDELNARFIVTLDEAPGGLAQDRELLGVLADADAGRIMSDVAIVDLAPGEHAARLAYYAVGGDELRAAASLRLAVRGLVRRHDRVATFTLAAPE